MFTPRYYQKDSVDATFHYFRSGEAGNPINVLPTGTGKSLVIALFIQQALAESPNIKVMMLTHVKELIQQNYETMMKVNPAAPVGIYSAALRRRDTNHQIIYGGVGSVAKRANEFGKVDLIMIDECHLVSPKSNTMYRKFISDLTDVNPNLRVIGYTATPFRLGVGFLTDGDLFTDVCYSCADIDGFNRLVAEGFLAPVVPKRTKSQLDVSSVRVVGGEYVQKELQQSVDKESVTREALKELLTEGSNRKHWLIFATGISHSNHIVEMLGEMGVPAVSVHSKLKASEREQAIADFRAGRVRALVNTNILTTGFDFPAIDLICVLRPTSSPALWVQMLGRGTRPCEGKENCLVLDFAGNTARLGAINDPVMPKKRGSGNGGTPPLRLCDACSCYCHAAMRACPNCDEEFPAPQTKLLGEAGTDKLIVGAPPTIEEFTVTSVSYEKYHPRNGNPPLLLVKYRCGLRVFSDWVHLESNNSWAYRKAVRWWERRYCLDDEIPPDVDTALALQDGLRRPAAIRVLVKKKHSQVLAYQYAELTEYQKGNVPF